MSESKYFDNQEFHPIEINGKEVESPNLIDGTQMLAQKGMVLSFYHVPSKRQVYFKAFITAFNETYNSDWSAESVYGRADPIYLFKNTTRKITLAYKVPCSTMSEGYENLAKVQQLVQFLYPSYESPGNATTIGNSPLVRIKFINFLNQNPRSKMTSNSSPQDHYNAYTTSGSPNKGLLGVINTISINHNLENPDIGVLEKGGETVDALLPKMIEVNLDFSPIHERPLGWDAKKNFSSPNFPYGATMPKEDTLAGDTDMEELNALWAQWDIEDMFWNPPAGPADESLMDDEEREAAEAAAQHEQNVANAEARYAGLFGKMRYNADVKRVARADASGKELTDKQQYMDSAIAGVTGPQAGYDGGNPYDWTEDQINRPLLKQWGD